MHDLPVKTLTILVVALASVPYVADAQRKPADRPVVAIPRAPSMPGAQALVAWRTESVRCADMDVPNTGIMLPRPTFGWERPGEQSRVTFEFAVDGKGRPIDIRRAAETNYVPNADDLAPALAASSLAPGRPHRDCRVTYVATRTPIAAANVPDLIAATIEARPSREVIALIKPANSDCFDRPPARLLRGYPDFPKLRGSVGRLQWSMVQFDIDKAGKPVRVRTLAGTNDNELDAAARDAVAKSRFSGSERIGCLYPYWKSALRRPAPDSPGKDTFRPAGATCPVEVEWATKPALQYPDNYRKSGIEGWAIVGFDVAPWGATGNVRVLAAEPSVESVQPQSTS